MLSLNCPGGCDPRRLMRSALALTALLAPASPFAAAPSSADQPPQRVIALAPHITELLFAAGAGGKVVATVNSANAPSEARALPRIGDGVLLNAEALLSFRPDLLIAWHPGTALSTLEPLLRRTGAKILYSAPQSLAAIPDEIHHFGTLFQTQAIADPAADALRQRVDKLRQRYASRPPLTVLLDLGEFPIYTLANDASFNSVLAHCGGRNLYADSSLPALQVERETVLSRNPDAVLVAASPALSRKRQAYWAQLKLPAAQRGHVLRLDPDLLLRPGPRQIDAAEQVCQFLEQVRQSVASK